MCVRSRLTAEPVPKVGASQLATDGTVKIQLTSYPRGGRERLRAALLLTLAALAVPHRAEAGWGEATGDPGHVRPVLEAAAGSRLANVFVPHLGMRVDELTEQLGAFR
jgi:hypothetical protein